MNKHKLAALLALLNDFRQLVDPDEIKDVNRVIYLVSAQADVNALAHK